MPHQLIEYSANLDAHIDIDELVRVMHDTAVAIEALPTPGIRTRAFKREHYRIADGHADNAFVYVTLRIVAGRTGEVKKAVGEKLWTALGAFFAALLAERPVALTLEIQEIDPELRWKGGNIREHMAKRAN